MPNSPHSIPAPPHPTIGHMAFLGILGIAEMERLFQTISHLCKPARPYI
ncbi:hypothetical protein [Andreprevotia chitinilytica]|nr:hypothetical protein [Andreprevotia chitinilytica]